MTDPLYHIGFANLSEDIPFAVTVRESLQAAAARYPNLALVCRDNQLNSDLALQNIEAFAALPIDVCILYHIDQRVNSKLAAILRAKRIPVITIDIPIPFVPFFGINNRQAGALAGQALAEWIQANWNGHVDRVLVMTEPRVLEIVRLRVDAALDSLKSLLNLSSSSVLYVDSGNERAISANYAHDVLVRWADVQHIAAICFNDESGMGFLDAARALNGEERVAIVAHGANLAIPEFRNHPETRFVAAIAYYPEKYGLALIDLVMRVLNGTRIPNETFVEVGLVTPRSYQTP